MKNNIYELFYHYRNIAAESVPNPSLYRIVLKKNGNGYRGNPSVTVGIPPERVRIF